MSAFVNSLWRLSSAGAAPDAGAGMTVRVARAARAYGLRPWTH